jgi:hypothetical protein
MTSDLGSIFKRARNLRNRIKLAYPEVSEALCTGHAH